MKYSIKKETKTDNGGVMVEFAIILPILLFIIVALIIFPLSSFYTKTILIDAAREGARVYAIEFETGESAKENAEDLIKTILENNGLDTDDNLDIGFSATNCGKYVAVSIDFKNPSILTDIIGFDIESSTLHASSVFKKEYYED